MKQRILSLIGMLGAVAGLCGCNSGATVLDAVDAGPPDDVGTPDDAQSDAADAASPISDWTPRIVPLLGTGAAVVIGMPSWAERPTLYLPNGWHAGAEAWLDLERFTFDADGVGRPTCHLTPCTVTLDPTDGCAHYHYNDARVPVASDVLYTANGDLVACDDGSTAPAPSVILTATVPGSERSGLGAPLPTSAVVAATLVPIDITTALHAVVRVDGLDEAATVVSTPGTITLTPMLPFRMGATVTLALERVTDVMGREFTEPVALHTLTTTSIIVDPTFTVSPPDGAVLTNGAATSLDAGVFCLGGGFRSCTNPADYPLGIALALGDPASSTLLSLTLNSAAHSRVPVFASIARADGTTAAVVSLALPGADIPVPVGSGPVWLLLYATEQPPGPCPAEGGFPSVCLDSIALH